MKIKSIKTRIVIYLLPVVISIMCLLTIISENSSKNLINKEIENKMSYKLDETEQKIKNSLDKHAKISEGLARNIETLDQKLEKEQYGDLIKNLIKSNDETFGAGVFYEPNKYKVDTKFFGPYVFKDNDKLIYTDDYSKDDANYDKEAWYTKGKNTKESIVWSDVYVDPVTKKTMVTSTAPFYDKNGELLGVATGDIDITRLQEMINEIKIGTTGKAILVDRNGSYLAGVDNSKIMNVKISEDKDSGLMSLANELLSGKDGNGEFENDKSSNRVYYKTIPETNWVILISISEKELNAPIAELTFKLLLTIAVSIVLIVLLVIMVSKTITKNIKDVNDLSKVVSNGDLSHVIEVNSEDELGQMSDNLNEMIKNIKEIVKNISQNLESLVATSEELTASAEQTDNAAEQIAISIQQVAIGSNDQSQLSKDIVSEATEIDKNMRKFIENLNHVNQASTDAVNTAQGGKNAINGVVNQIELIKEKVTQSSEIVNVLGTKSNEIGQIVSLITSIAEQTNLLALNAAIEAARAGEHGKGFSVVAEEVRKLAEQSSYSANQIGELIKEIQENIVGTVEAMNQGNVAVNDGIEKVKNAGQSFDGINKAVSSVSIQMKDMTELINNMTLKFENMVSTIEKISIISEDNSDNAQGVAAAAEEQTAIMKEVVQASKGLVSMAENLEESISFFKM